MNKFSVLDFASNKKTIRSDGNTKREVFSHRENAKLVQAVDLLGEDGVLKNGYIA